VGFVADVGIDVEIFRAKGSDLLQRVLQESSAGRVGFDVLILSGPEMLIVDDEGLLAPFTSPNTADIVASEVNPNWVGVYLNVFTAAWNTDLVAAGAEPLSWEQVLTENPDALGLESGDFDWFATLVQDYFMAELGYTEAEAIDLFRTAMADGRVIDGHTVMTELLGAGEFDVVTSAYQHSVERLKSDGSPIDWQPAVEPLVIRSSGISIHTDTETPASSLLFADWLLSASGQEVLASRYRTPANTTVEGGLGDGLNVLAIDIEALQDSREKWEPLYEELIRGS
jgi:iron(III) transport system substrate-binding protein